MFCFVDNPLLLTKRLVFNLTLKVPTVLKALFLRLKDTLPLNHHFKITIMKNLKLIFALVTMSLMTQGIFAQSTEKKPITKKENKESIDTRPATYKADRTVTRNEKKAIKKTAKVERKTVKPTAKQEREMKARRAKAHSKPVRANRTVTTKKALNQKQKASKKSTKKIDSASFKKKKAEEF